MECLVWFVLFSVSDPFSFAFSLAVCVHDVPFNFESAIASGEERESENADQIHEMHEHELQLRLALGNDV